MNTKSLNFVSHPLALTFLAAAILLPLTLQNTAAGILLATVAVAAIATKADLIRGGLFVIIALVPLESLGQLGQTDLANLTVTKLLFPLALLALLLDHILRNRPFVLNASMWWAFAFGLTLALSFWVNERTPFALDSLRRYLSVLAFYFFTLHAIRGPGDVRNLIIVMVGACAFSAAVGLVGSLFGGASLQSRMMYGGSDRLIGLATVNPNTYAAQLSVAFWFCVCLLAWEKRMTHMALLATAILMFGAAMMMTYSRAVVICLAVSGVHFVLKSGMLVRSLRIASAAALLAVCFLPLIPEGYGQRLVSLVTEEAHTDSSLQRRWSYHVIGVQLVENHPVLGVGPGNFQREYMSESYRFHADTFEGRRLLHNLYLSIASQLGLLGLLAFLFLGITTLRSLWRLQESHYDEGIRRLSVMLEIGLVSFLLNSFFLPHEYQKFMWLLLAVPPGLEWALKRQTAEGRDESGRDSVQGVASNAAFQSRITP